MTKTVRENYEDLLGIIGLTEEELKQKFVPVIISSDVGTILFDGKTERAMVAFVYTLCCCPPYIGPPWTIGPLVRLELLRYATDDLVYAARSPVTYHQVLRTLLGNNVSIKFAQPSLC